VAKVVGVGLLGRVVGSGSADSILWFRLESGGGGMERCKKMKQSERARIDSMRRKYDTT
jgi:hypothetical protein